MDTFWIFWLIFLRLARDDKHKRIPILQGFVSKLKNILTLFGNKIIILFELCYFLQKYKERQILVEEAFFILCFLVGALPASILLFRTQAGQLI